MKNLMMAAVVITTCGVAFAAEDTCGDGMCPRPASPAEAEFAVLSPVPETAVETVRQGPRIKSLEGKTIALVGGSFMASVTHSELKNLILKEYPTAKVYLLNEIGSAGAYPRPGVVRREKDEFQRKLRDFKVDAVISGNGGCGLCTPKETGSCIAAEVLGLPSVMVAGPGFVKQAKSTARACGIRLVRVAYAQGARREHAPGPVAGREEGAYRPDNRCRAGRRRSACRA